MFGYASKLFFGLGAIAMVLAIAYGVAVGDQSGITLFVSLAIASGVAGLVTVGVRDSAPRVAPDAPAPEMRPVADVGPARGSVWPLLGAVAGGILAVGAAVGAEVVIGGVIAALLVAGGWFAQAWREHPSWNPRLGSLVSERLTAPVALPVGAFLLVVVIAVSLSRVLLAIPKEAASVLALAVAIAILGGLALVAARPRVASSALAVLAVVAAGSVVAAGVVGAVSGEREFEKHEADVPAERELEAEGIAFTTDRLEFPAGEAVDLRFVNKDAGIYHNVGIYSEGGGHLRGGTAYWNGVGFPGVDERTYDVPKLKAGTYSFICDFHENMRGTLEVG